MYLSADFARLKKHLEILREEKKANARFTERLIAESTLCDDLSSMRLRKLAEKSRRLEHSIDGRIQWIEDLISDFKTISYQNQRDIEDQLSYLYRIIEE